MPYNRWVGIIRDVGRLFLVGIIRQMGAFILVGTLRFMESVYFEIVL